MKLVVSFILFRSKMACKNDYFSCVQIKKKVGRTDVYFYDR